jgi:hypothetical protein
LLNFQLHPTILLATFCHSCNCPLAIFSCLSPHLYDEMGTLLMER